MCAEVGGFEGMRRCAEGKRRPFVIVVRPSLSSGQAFLLMLMVLSVSPPGRFLRYISTVSQCAKTTIAES